MLDKAKRNLPSFLRKPLLRRDLITLMSSVRKPVSLLVGGGTVPWNTLVKRIVVARPARFDQLANTLGGKIIWIR